MNQARRVPGRRWRPLNCIGSPSEPDALQAGAGPWLGSKGPGTSSQPVAWHSLGLWLELTPQGLDVQL